MDANRVILHVGWPKTATTSLQSQLRNYPNLAGKPFGRDGALLARKVVDDIARSSNWSPTALEELIVASWRDQSLPVLLSNESLIEMPQREWFDDLVGPFEIARRLAQCEADKRVLMTLRDPRNLLRSTWLHHVREGRVQSYPDFLARILDDRKCDRGSFSIGLLGNMYGDLFGYDNVAIAFSEDFANDPVRFWERFAEFFGIKTFAPDLTNERPRLNETTLGPIRFEMSVNRLLNVYGRTLRQGNTRELRRAVTRRVSRRLNVDHSKFFSRFSTLETQLVSELTDDVASLRRRFTVL